MKIFPELYYLLSFLFMSAVFSGLEIAFVTADKLMFELKRQQGSKGAALISKFIEHPSNFISTMLVGNNLMLVLYGIYMASLLDPILASNFSPPFDNQVFLLLVQTIISTIVVLVTAEFLPKRIFLINPNSLLTLFAIPIRLIMALFHPVVWLVVRSTRYIITRWLKLEYNEDKPVFGLTDLNNYVKKTLETETDEEDTPESVDTRILDNALEFKTVKVRECMIPRTEIVAIDINSPIEDLKQLFVDSGHSKILIYSDSIDEIKGYCHSLKMFKKPGSIKEIMTKIIIVPETVPANELMIQFIQDRKSVALVVDEYGGTSGIVTMEDIIEEIFGEIRDEHDDEDLIEEKLNDEQFVLSARNEIDYLNEKYLLQIPEGDYDTLGGYILEVNENIPSVNDVVIADQFEITILSLKDNRIDKVKLEVKSKPNTFVKE